MENGSRLTDTYCYHIMQGVSISGVGRARPCCVSEPMNIKNFVSPESLKIFSNDNDKGHVCSNLEELINDPVLKKIRANMLLGKRSDECKYCYAREDAGLTSFRQIHNDIHEDKIDKKIKNVRADGFLKTEAISYLDITLGNICNLKCRTCNPWSSHSWLEEAKVIPHINIDSKYSLENYVNSEQWYVHAFKTGFFDDVLPNVKHINFLGGEPLVVEVHYEWLQKIVEKGLSKEIELHYNTNLTTLPRKILEIWKYFKMIHLSLSIDAVGKLAYYVRYPSKWKTIEKNVDKLISYSTNSKNFSVQTHLTLSVLNIFDIDNVLNWCIEQYNKWHFIDNKSFVHYGYRNMLPHVNIVENPEYMHVRHLPNDVKNIVCKKIDKVCQYISHLGIPDWEINKLNDILNLKSMINLDRNEKSWNKFIENTNASDAFRKLSIKEYINWTNTHI